VPALLAYFKAKNIRELLGSGKLALDWWNGGIEGDEDILVLAPNLKYNNDTQYPGDPTAPCTFFTDDGLCAIHPVKPYECAEYLHEGNEVTNKRHERVAEVWERSQLLEEFRDEVVFFF
jgi:Fe-S-cluster containining protein